MFLGLVEAAVARPDPQPEPGEMPPSRPRRPCAPPRAWWRSSRRARPWWRGGSRRTGQARRRVAQDAGQPGRVLPECRATRTVPAEWASLMLAPPTSSPSRSDVEPAIGVPRCGKTVPSSRNAGNPGRAAGRPVAGPHQPARHEPPRARHARGRLPGSRLRPRYEVVSRGLISTTSLRSASSCRMKSTPTNPRSPLTACTARRGSPSPNAVGPGSRPPR